MRTDCSACGVIVDRRGLAAHRRGSLCGALKSTNGDGGVLPIALFHALSFWAVKRRAGDVGERFARECMTPLWHSLSRAPRLHLVGHSFGARLVASIALGGARPTSMTLLLGAFSAFAFAPEVPGFDRPGFYHRVLAERRVEGATGILRSDHDAALRALYPDVDRHAARPGRAASVATVATSALGTVGARGVGAPDLELLDVQRTGIPRYPIVNIDGSRVVRAHGGLLVGGPDGVRPRTVDPLNP